MLLRKLAAVTLRNQPAFCDADQRIVRLVVRRGGKERLVGGDKRNALAVGKIDQYRLVAFFRGGAVALQFDIEPVAEQLMERIEPTGCQMALAGRYGAIQRPIGAAGEADDAVGLPGKPFHLQARWFVEGGIEESAR